MRRLTDEEREISKERQREYFRQYLKTPLGRAHDLLGTYRVEDRKRDRGECTLTAQWIVDNIFTKPCAHCGETDWRKIGCNRLDNSKPHTEDNVEPCCQSCNSRLAANDKATTVDQIDKVTGEVIATYRSLTDAAKDVGCSIPSIKYCCCGGKYDIKKGKWVNHYSAKGYVWKSHL